MVGDCIGLPREGLSPRRAEKIFGRRLRHALVAGRGLASDDTEHACMTAQAYLRAPDDPERFARSLAWKLRLWLLGLPAGIGFATLRAMLKLWIGVPPGRSGVFSAGNGPAMRSPVLGVAMWDDPERLTTMVRASTRLTHTDPKAERGALATAVAARYAATHDPDTFRADEALAEVASVFPADDVEAARWLDALRSAPEEDAGTASFVSTMGFDRGVSGYMYHTVPAALWAWLRHPFDYAAGLERVIAMGGDTDTVGAVYGGISGAGVGRDGIPKEWIEGIIEVPRSTEWVRLLAARVAEQGQPMALGWPLFVVRNPLMLLIVIAHGFRRLFPPY